MDKLQKPETNFSESNKGQLVLDPKTLKTTHRDRVGHTFISGPVARDGTSEAVCHDFITGNVRFTYERNPTRQSSSFKLSTINEMSVLEFDENGEESWKKVDPGTGAYSTVELQLRSGVHRSQNQDIIFRVATPDQRLVLYYKFEGKADIYDYDAGNSSTTPTFRLHQLEPV